MDISVEGAGSGGVLVLRFSAEEVRRMYYSVLGLEAPGGSLEEYEGKGFSWHDSVDLPEDVLRCERALGK